MGGVTLLRKHQAELISVLPMEFNSIYDVVMSCELASTYHILGAKDIDERTDGWGQNIEFKP